MRKQWPAPLAVNLLLGLPAVVPFWLLFYFAVNWPLKARGLTVGNPTENDGVLPWVIVATPVLAVFALGWVSAAATAAPTLALVAAG
ncbi:hypothetical protein G5C51_08760 [Streptomyces sp. A7024]|uniref:Integral membrane protein n=1 Tax=Streptomyces coryli TaxID=1128680 RepID=A0A6G4TVS9_9ACTN|nr:hypothetical protein [Streptomyces coryli]NGN63994.1 hypothetical protein [Streptomyces coryli]